MKKDLLLHTVFLPCFMFFSAFMAYPLIAQQTGVSLKLVQIDPVHSPTIPLNESLNLHIQYQSPQPIRLQALGRFQGKDIRDLGNASPIYPAGSGNGLVWIAFRQPAQIDEIVVVASDARWKPLQTLTIPMNVSWHSQSSGSISAPWVQNMSASQQQQISEEIKKSASSSGFDFIAWGLFSLSYICVPAYLLLQIFSLCRYGVLSLSSLPLLFMVPVITFTSYALGQKSNLWPIYLLICSPVGVFYLLIVLFWQRKKSV